MSTMQNRQNGKQMMIFGGIAIVLVLVIGFVFTRGGSGSSSSVSAAQTAPVVVAQQTVPQGTVIRAGDSPSQYFTVKQVPVTLVPFGAYSSLNQIANLTKTAGCGPVQSAGCQGDITTTQTIYQSTPVVSGMFSTLGQYRQAVGPSFAIPYGYVGIAVNFDAANSVYGSVSAGDSIDLIASWKGGKAGNLNAVGQTQYAMNNLRVISVNAPPALAGSTQSSTNTNTSQASTASGGTLVLVVRYQQALEIQHLKDFGWQLSCVLRSAKDTAIKHFKTTPVTDKWFFVKTADSFKVSPGY
ncbi:MAG: hypothetical protein NVSMB6_32180 [Burkholderiaceae bacterium]